MKIIYLSDSTIPSKMANSVHVMKMCQAFAENGHDTTLIANYGSLIAGDDFRRYGVKSCFAIRKLWRPKNVFPKPVRISIYTWQLRKAISAMQPMPNLLYGRDMNSFAALADLKIPMIYEAHSAPSDPATKEKFATLFKQPHFSRLIVISDALRTIYNEMFPWLPAEKMLIAHDAADLVSVAPPEPGFDNWPGRKGCLQIGYVGHLYPGKGMEVIAQLAPLVPDVDFHIVGGMSKDIAYWRKQCNSANIFFHGYVDHGSLGKYFPNFDVVIAPYISGKINAARSPLKLFEYMAAQKLILASDIPVLREVLVHKENCLLASPDNIDEWIKAIELIKDNPSLRAQLAARAYEDFLAQYTWSKRAQRVLVGMD